MMSSYAGIVTPPNDIGIPGIILGMGSANEGWRHPSLVVPIPRIIPGIHKAFM